MGNENGSINLFRKLCRIERLFCCGYVVQYVKYARSRFFIAQSKLYIKTTKTCFSISSLKV